MTSMPVFQTSLAFERRWTTEVVRAVLSTVLFHRALGGFQPTTLEVCGVTFSAPAAAEAEAVIAAKTDLICRALLGGNTSATPPPPKRVKLYVALYPTPLGSLSAPSAPTRPRQRTGSYTPTIQRAPSPAAAATATPAAPATAATAYGTTDATNSSSSPTRSSRRASAAAIAQAAPAAVTSALGWFSASARAALIGGSGGGNGGAQDEATASSTGAADAINEEQEQEIRLVEALKAQGRKPFEGWVIEFEVVSELPNSRGRRPSGGDDKLRAQLHDFLLRTLDFTLRQTAHIPPITTTDLMPYGILILVDPPTAPFQVPKPIIEQVGSFPELHRTLVTSAQGKLAQEGGGGGQRAASVGARW
ncbi:hypothetical protein JCM10908_005159 [Rhodotorula pacifica]|uniref:uncharacterized protein n=1 Tax=Rhodotorula pacifica TaxID=1495444 RepID=UPI00316E1CAC